MAARTQTSHSFSSNASGALEAAERAVMERRTELLALFEKAASADRLFALDRMLRDEALRPDDEAVVLAAHGKARAAWAAARTAKITGAALAHKRHELDLMVAENEIAGLLSQRGLFDTLFRCAESYLRVVPRSPLTPSFRELVRRRDELRRARLSILEPVIDAA